MRNSLVELHKSPRNDSQSAGSYEQLKKLQILSSQIASKIDDLLFEESDRERAQDSLKSDFGELSKDQLFISWLGETYKSRAQRNRFLAFSDILGEPAWDIVLDAAYNRLLGKNVSIKAACLSSHTPASTSLRYISRLVELGVANKRSDPNDRRREFLEITDSTLRDLHRLFLYCQSCRSPSVATGNAWIL